MDRGRDFLRENKLNLRELQRVSTTKNKEAQQKEQQRLMRYMPRQQQALIQQAEQQQRQYQKKPRETYVSRRSSSETRAQLAAQAQQAKQQSVAGCPKKKSMTGRKPESSRKDADECNSKIDCRRMLTGKSVNDGDGDVCDPRLSGSGIGNCSTAGTLLSRTEYCDKQMQTDDIWDEKFLYEALQKCSTANLKAQYVKTGLQREDSVPAVADCYGRERQSMYEGEDHMYDHMYQYQERQQNGFDNNLGARSKFTVVSRERSDIAANLEVDLLDNCEQVSLESESDEQSANSHRTVISTQLHDRKISLTKKRSTGKVYKLDNCEDVRPPRCSEREKCKKLVKREKYEKVQMSEHESDEDPDCPTGHYLLPEEDRCSMLKIRDKKIKILVNELSQMPITSQTLRIRTRRNEIEKEVTQLEAEIKAFSKPKVYWKQEQTEM